MVGRAALAARVVPAAGAGARAVGRVAPAAARVEAAELAVEQAVGVTDPAEVLVAAPVVDPVVAAGRAEAAAAVVNPVAEVAPVELVAQAADPAAARAAGVTDPAGRVGRAGAPVHLVAARAGAVVRAAGAVAPAGRAAARVEDPVVDAVARAAGEDQAAVGNDPASGQRGLPPSASLRGRTTFIAQHPGPGGCPRGQPPDRLAP